MITRYIPMNKSMMEIKDFREWDSRPQIPLKNLLVLLAFGIGLWLLILKWVVTRWFA